MASEKKAAGGERRKGRWRVAAVLTFLTVLVAGCWDYREINELAFVTAVGLDRATRARDVKVSCLIAIPGGGAPGGGGGGGGGGGAGSQTPALMESAVARSVGDAFTKLNSLTGRALSNSHTQVLVFGEQLARQGLEPALDVFTRWYEFRRTMVVYVARPSAEQCLDLESPLVKDPTVFLHNLARVSAALGVGSSTPLQDLLEALQSYTTEAVVPLIEPVQGPHLHMGGPGPEGGGGGGGRVGGGGTGGGSGQVGQGPAPTKGPAVRLAGLAVFRGDRMVATLSPAETIYWLLLTGKLKRTFLTVRDPLSPDNSVTLELADLKRRVRGGSLSRPSLEVALAVAGATQEIESGRDYSTERNRRALEREVEGDLRRGMARLIRRAQTEFRTDIFHFGDAYVGKFLYWDDWRRYNWLHERFPQAAVRLAVKVTLVRPGTTLMPIRPVFGGPVPLVEEATAGEAGRRPSGR
jgi:spore germination protein KC